MNIEVKYDVGDKINLQFTHTLNEYENCSFCNGTGEIQGADNTILPCPRCNGQKRIRKTQIQMSTDTIRNIIVRYESEHMTKPEILYQTINGATIQQEDVVKKL